MRQKKVAGKHSFPWFHLDLVSLLEWSSGIRSFDDHRQSLKLGSYFEIAGGIFIWRKINKQTNKKTLLEEKVWGQIQRAFDRLKTEGKIRSRSWIDNRVGHRILGFQNLGFDQEWVAPFLWARRAAWCQDTFLKLKVNLGRVEEKQTLEAFNE